MKNYLNENNRKTKSQHFPASISTEKETPDESKQKKNEFSFQKFFDSTFFFTIQYNICGTLGKQFTYELIIINFRVNINISDILILFVNSSSKGSLSGWYSYLNTLISMKLLLQTTLVFQYLSWALFTHHNPKQKIIFYTILLSI